MTNGEKLKEIFPSIQLYEKSHDAIQINFNSTWWNAEYKEQTTKNDLGVDREQSKIEALEQEPELDKIRAEIEHHRRKTQSIDPYDLVGDCLDIIDKYKAESEE